MRIYERNNSADIKVSEKRGAGGAPGTPAACGEDHSEAGCLPAGMEVHGGADIHLQPMEDAKPEQVDA